MHRLTSHQPKSSYLHTQCGRRAGRTHWSRSQGSTWLSQVLNNLRLHHRSEKTWVLDAGEAHESWGRERGSHGTHRGQGTWTAGSSRAGNTGLMQEGRQAGLQLFQSSSRQTLAAKGLEPVGKQFANCTDPEPLALYPLSRGDQTEPPGPSSPTWRCSRPSLTAVMQH